MACGDWHMLAVVGDKATHVGKCFAVGFNKYGELGTGDISATDKFVAVPGLGPVTTASAGRHVSFFVDSGRKLYSCGVAALHGNPSASDQLVPTIVSAPVLTREGSEAEGQGGDTGFGRVRPLRRGML